MNEVYWYSRTDTKLHGQVGLQIEIRYGLKNADLRYRQHITGGHLCGRISIRGTYKGESAAARCAGAPISLTDGPKTFITLQSLNRYKNFLMVGEVVIN